MKGNWLAPVIENSKGVSGFRHGWIQELHEVLSNLSLFFSVICMGSFSGRLFPGGRLQWLPTAVD